MRRRLRQIAAGIADLHGEVRTNAGEHPGKRGQPAPKPNPILFTHYEIGTLVREYMDVHKELHGWGNNAVEALSTDLGGDLRPTHLYNHAKYARFRRPIVKQHVEEGRAWRDVARLKPKEEMRDDLEL